MLGKRKPIRDKSAYLTYEELKKDISDISGRKIGVAIYQNEYFFQNYHCDNISRLKLKLKSEVL